MASDTNNNTEVPMDFIVISTFTNCSYRYGSLREASEIASTLIARTAERVGNVIEIRSIVSGEVVTKIERRWVNYNRRWIPQH